MKSSKSFVVASEVRNATAPALVKEQTIDWNLCFVCGNDESKSVQLTKPSTRKGKARQYFFYCCLHHAFPVYLVQQQ